MPLPAMASAAPRTSAAVTLQAKWFQLFQPIGGVAATPESTALPAKDAANRKLIRMKCFIFIVLSPPGKVIRLRESYPLLRRGPRLDGRSSLISKLFGGVTPNKY